MDSLTDTRQPLASSPCGGRSPRTVSAARRIFFHGGKRRRIPPGFRHFGRETLCASTPHPRSGDDNIINRLFVTICGKIKADTSYLEVSAFYQKMQSQSFIALYIRLAASFASGSNGSTETLQMLWSGYSRKNFAIAFTASFAITSQSPQYVPSLIVLLLILKYVMSAPFTYQAVTRCKRSCYISEEPCIHHR